MRGKNSSITWTYKYKQYIYIHIKTSLIITITSAICLIYLECAPSVRTSSSLSTASCENDEASLTNAWRLWCEEKTKLKKKSVLNPLEDTDGSYMFKWNVKHWRYCQTWSVFTFGYHLRSQKYLSCTALRPNWTNIWNNYQDQSNYRAVFTWLS